MTNLIQRSLKLATLIISMIPVMASAQSEVTISSNITEDTQWHAENTYILDGVVFVTNNAELSIEAGTVIKAEDGQNLNASALVISRDGQIFAEGTPENPIIFTSVNDTDLQMGKNATGDWGGVVILGEAPTNNPSVKAVEGINEIVSQQNIELAQYGGDNPADSSGVFRYVSIRHTGINVGSSSGNEIQGLTLGAVGSGTTIEYVESFASADDGFEFFGGTVNTKYLVSAFVEDDGFDTDEGYRGKNQFWFVIQDTDAAGHMAEQDGSSTDAEDTKPFAYPQIANATYIGTGTYDDPGNTPSGDPEESILLRDNTGVRYVNSIFADDFKSPFLVVEDTESDEFDARARLEADSINFVNSVFAESLINGDASVMNDLGNAGYTNNMLSATTNNNKLADPRFLGISRNTDGNLKPHPQNTSVLTGAIDIEGDFWTDVDYRGAFGDRNWLTDWTALYSLGFTQDSTFTSIQEDLNGDMLPRKVKLVQNYPNPFNPTTNITFALPTTQQVTLSVYDLLGRKVATLVDGRQSAGNHTVTFDASKISSGIYIYRLSGSNFTLTKKMTLVK